MYSDEQGGTIGFRIMESVRMKQCPNLESTYKLIRGSIHRSGYIVRNKGDGSPTKLIHINQIDPKGSLPSWMTQRLIFDFGDVISRIQAHCIRLEVKGDGWVTKDNWLPFR